jgi:hypothetical protein
MGVVMMGVVTPVVQMVIRLLHCWFIGIAITSLL